MKFSLDEFFDDAGQQIVKFIDDIINKEIGYVGYTLLKLDMIRFDGNGQIKFQMPQDLRTLTKIIRVLGLNSIAEIDTNDIETLLFSMFLSGHYMNLMTQDNNGQVKLRKEYTYPGWEFFSNIYSSFTYLTPDPYYHLVMLQSFINSEMMETRNRVRENIIIFNEQGVDYWFGRTHQDLISLIFTEVAEGMYPSYIEKLKVVSVATIITPDGKVKHIVAINGDTRNQNDPPWRISKFLENTFGSDEILIAYTPQDQDRLFITPELDANPRENHAEVKILELLKNLNIAPNSKIYLSASLQTCITCRVTAWQYEILSDLKNKGITVEIYLGEGQDLLYQNQYSVEFSVRISTRDDFFNTYSPFFEDLENKLGIELDEDVMLLELWNRYRRFVWERLRKRI